jgi:hypothetical protein
MACTDDHKPAIRRRPTSLANQIDLVMYQLVLIVFCAVRRWSKALKVRQWALLCDVVRVVGHTLSLL